MKCDFTDNVARRTAVFLGAIAFSTGPVFAQPPTSSAKTETIPLAANQTAVEPWSVGVTAADKMRAQELLARGNQLLVQSRYADALEFYERATRAWNHPAIYANMVICFMSLGRTLEAYTSARVALSHGAAPFDKREVHAATRRLMKLLAAQVGFVQVRCTNPGVTITLDGQPLGECPVARRHLIAGRHELVARKDGFLTVTHDFVATGRATEKVELALISLSDAAPMERPWNAWMPVAVTGSGAVVLSTGILLRRWAVKTLDRYDAGLLDACGTEGCDTYSYDVAALKPKAERLNTIAITTISAGAALTAAGLVLLYFNRPRPVPADDSRTIQVLPTLTPGAACISFGFTF